MKLTTDQIINREQGKNAIVVGTGPSLKKHINTINTLFVPNNDWIIIGCNDVDIMTPFDFEYWVLANNQYTIRKIYKRLNKRNATVAYADTIDLTPRPTVDSLLTKDYFPYEIRHFYGKVGCTGGACCKHIIDGRLPIQKEVQKYTNYHTFDTSCDTVAIPMLYLSVLLGCKKIYVTGVDLDYTKGYVNSGPAHGVDIAESINVRNRILNTISVINESAKNINAKIYCLDDGLPISGVLEHSTLSL